MKIIKLNKTNFRKYFHQIVNLLIKAFTTGYYFQQTLNKKWVEKYVDEIFQNRGYGFLSLNKEEVLGFTILTPIPIEFSFPKRLKEKYNLKECCFLLELVVIKKQQRRGLGTKLVKKIIDSIDKEKYRYVFLKTIINNEPALRLYQKLGFRKSIVIKEAINKKNKDKTLYVRKQVLVKGF